MDYDGPNGVPESGFVVEGTVCGGNAVLPSPPYPLGYMEHVKDRGEEKGGISSLYLTQASAAKTLNAFLFY